MEHYKDPARNREYQREQMRRIRARDVAETNARRIEKGLPPLRVRQRTPKE